MKYLFGPVVSRRLGRSLGIDLIPFKTCSLDCVYCECGRTTNLSADPAAYAPVDEVLSELRSFLSGSPDLDVITFSGAGEPTLHSGIGALISRIKEEFPGYALAVLTNGTLLWKPEVRRALLPADIVVPSLDAVSSEVFRRILRPAEGITPERVVEGLSAFRREYSGRLVLEIFIVPGLNDTPEELALLKEACFRIVPDLVQLNRLDRPGTEPWVKPAGDEALARIAEYFSPLPVEAVGRPVYSGKGSGAADNIAACVVATLRRRPSTLEDLGEAAGCGGRALTDILDELMKAGTVIAEPGDRGTFYRLS